MLSTRWERLSRFFNAGFDKAEIARKKEAHWRGISVENFSPGHLKCYQSPFPLSPPPLLCASFYFVRTTHRGRRRRESRRRSRSAPCGGRAKSRYPSPIPAAPHLPFFQVQSLKGRGICVLNMNYQRLLVQKDNHAS